MRIHIYTAAVMAAVLLCSSPNILSAQKTDNPRDTTRIYQMEEVVISASRFEQPLFSVGRNVTVITREQIERSLAGSVGELLADQQSLHLIGGRQTPGTNQTMFLRNTDSDHTVVMIDGVRISDPSTVNNSIDLSELSLAGVQRIEIVRGSHSTLYGSSAIGGVVNIISAKGPQQGFSADVESMHGTFGSQSYSMTNRISGGYNFRNGIYLDIGAGHEYTEGIDATVDTVSATGGFRSDDTDDFRKVDLSGKLGYRKNGVNLYAAYRLADQRSDLDQGAFNDDDNAQISFQRDLFQYGGSIALSGEVELGLSGAFSDLNRDFVNDSSVVNAAGDYDGIFTETNATGELWENELTTTWRKDDFAMIAGAGNNQQRMNVRTFTFARPFNFTSETDLDSLNLKQVINHLFVHTEIGGELLGSKLAPLTLVLGGRLTDHNQFGLHGTFEINPRVTFSGSTIYAAVTTGYNAPSLFQLHSPDRGFGAFTDRGNENLQPETSHSYELGWKQQLGKQSSLELSLFRTEVRNIIEYVYLWDANVAIDNLGFSDFLGDTYLNLSRQRINGIEVGVRTSLGAKLGIRGNLTYTSSELQLDPDDIDRSYTGGNHVQVFESGQFLDTEKELEGLTRRPSVSAALKVDYQLLSALNIGAESRFVGSRDDIFFSGALGPIGALDRSEIDNYNITDLRFRYRFNSSFELSGKVENIFDTDYVEIRGFTTRGRGFFLKAKYRFGR
ncbi:MAG: TonB-dependent receptor [Balneolaceae bacterium]|nr:TonB-dependent receptor [Balneolaceae bacterium]